MNVEIDIIESIAAPLIGLAELLVVMYVKILKTYIIVLSVTS